MTAGAACDPAGHPFDRLDAAGSAEERTRLFALIRKGPDGLVAMAGDAQRHATLVGIAAPRARMRRIDLSFADLREADLSGAFLAQARLHGAGLEHARLAHADLSHSDCARSSFSEADLSQALLEEADLSFASLRFARLTGAALEGACLASTDLWSARLDEADLAAADLRQAVIREASAVGARFDGADLRGASLMDTSFADASFVDADLRDANLKGAVLRGANLCRARLQGVDLTSCDLSGARWSMARLDRTLIERDQIGAAVGEESAGEFAAAAGAYTALERNFLEQSDIDAASWAYRRKRRMQKKAMGVRARLHWRAGRWFAAASAWTGYLGDTVVEAVCDYGESISRVFASLAALYVGFLLLYGVTGSVVRVEGSAHVPTSRAVDLALFSLASMTSNAASSNTLLPSHSYATFLAGAQATISIFLMGLLGFVAGNRIRR